MLSLPLGSLYSNLGLLARSQYESGRSCDRPIRPRCSGVFLGSRGNAQSVPKNHAYFPCSPPNAIKISSSWCPQTQNSTQTPNSFLLLHTTSSSATVCYSLPEGLPRHQQKDERPLPGSLQSSNFLAHTPGRRRRRRRRRQRRRRRRQLYCISLSPTHLPSPHSLSLSLSLSLCVSLQIVNINTTCYLKTTNAMTQTPVCLSALSLQGTN